MKLAVEPAEKAFLLAMSVGIDRFQNGRTQRRSQRQSQESGKNHGSDHGDRELPVNGANGTAEESHRNKNSGQNQRNADDGSCNLSHRLVRGIPGRQPFFGHDTLHVFNHHESIVDQDADG